MHRGSDQDPNLPNGTDSTALVPATSSATRQQQLVVAHHRQPTATLDEWKKQTAVRVNHGDSDFVGQSRGLIFTTRYNKTEQQEFGELVNYYTQHLKPQDRRFNAATFEVVKETSHPLHLLNPGTEKWAIFTSYCEPERDIILNWHKEFKTSVDSALPAHCAAIRQRLMDWIGNFQRNKSNHSNSPQVYFARVVLDSLEYLCGLEYNMATTDPLSPYQFAKGLADFIESMGGNTEFARYSECGGDYTYSEFVRFAKDLIKDSICFEIQELTLRRSCQDRLANISKGLKTVVQRIPEALFYALPIGYPKAFGKREPYGTSFGVTNLAVEDQARPIYKGILASTRAGMFQAEALADPNISTVLNLRDDKLQRNLPIFPGTITQVSQHPSKSSEFVTLTALDELAIHKKTRVVNRGSASVEVLEPTESKGDVIAVAPAAVSHHLADIQEERCDLTPRVDANQLHFLLGEDNAPTMPDLKDEPILQRFRKELPSGIYKLIAAEYPSIAARWLYLCRTQMVINALAVKAMWYLELAKDGGNIEVSFILGQMTARTFRFVEKVLEVYFREIANFVSDVNQMASQASKLKDSESETWLFHWKSNSSSPWKGAIRIFEELQQTYAGFRPDIITLVAKTDRKQVIQDLREAAKKIAVVATTHNSDMLQWGKLLGCDTSVFQVDQPAMQLAAGYANMLDYSSRHFDAVTADPSSLLQGLGNVPRQISGQDRFRLLEGSPTELASAVFTPSSYREFAQSAPRQFTLQPVSVKGGYVALINLQPELLAHLRQWHPKPTTETSRKRRDRLHSRLALPPGARRDSQLLLESGPALAAMATVDGNSVAPEVVPSVLPPQLLKDIQAAKAVPFDHPCANTPAAAESAENSVSVVKADQPSVSDGARSSTVTSASGRVTVSLVEENDSEDGVTDAKDNDSEDEVADAKHNEARASTVKDLRQEFLDANKIYVFDDLKAQTPEALKDEKVNRLADALFTTKKGFGKNIPPSADHITIATALRTFLVLSSTSHLVGPYANADLFQTFDAKADKNTKQQFTVKREQAVYRTLLLDEVQHLTEAEIISWLANGEDRAVVKKHPIFKEVRLFPGGRGTNTRREFYACTLVLDREFDEVTKNPQKATIQRLRELHDKVKAIHQRAIKARGNLWWPFHRTAINSLKQARAHYEQQITSLKGCIVNLSLQNLINNIPDDLSDLALVLNTVDKFNNPVFHPVYLAIQELKNKVTYDQRKDPNQKDSIIRQLTTVIDFLSECGAPLTIAGKMISTESQDTFDGLYQYFIGTGKLIQSSAQVYSEDSGTTYSLVSDDEDEAREDFKEVDRSAASSSAAVRRELDRVHGTSTADPVRRPSVAISPPSARGSQQAPRYKGTMFPVLVDLKDGDQPVGMESKVANFAVFGTHLIDIRAALTTLTKANNFMSLSAQEIGEATAQVNRFVEMYTKTVTDPFSEEDEKALFGYVLTDEKRQEFRDSDEYAEFKKYFSTAAAAAQPNASGDQTGQYQAPTLLEARLYIETKRMELYARQLSELEKLPDGVKKVNVDHQLDNIRQTIRDIITRDKVTPEVAAQRARVKVMGEIGKYEKLLDPSSKEAAEAKGSQEPLVIAANKVELAMWQHIQKECDPQSELNQMRKRIELYASSTIRSLMAGDRSIVKSNTQMFKRGKTEQVPFSAIIDLVSEALKAVGDKRSKELMKSGAHPNAQTPISRALEILQTLRTCLITRGKDNQLVSQQIPYSAPVLR